MSRRRALSRRTRPFQESVIREMTRLHAEVGGVNLAQGLPDFDPPTELVDALARAIEVPSNHQYGWTWGLPALRAAVSAKTERMNRVRSDPETEVTITCGVSEAVAASVLALTERGDEVIILEPWYENYVPACVLGGVRPRFVALSEPPGNGIGRLRLIDMCIAIGADQRRNLDPVPADLLCEIADDGKACDHLERIGGGP